ncbi:hypothetical protein OC842_001640 [Tilletia horrida]|uniref:F-box domain-containing protein n=1 Tax=Tilletia horrida TaxID=155126 RepID=A0AAN6GG21_9BASI|nr:hypothetical protein OC842_001640 [Tilletia horrida]
MQPPSTPKPKASTSRPSAAAAPAAGGGAAARAAGPRKSAASSVPTSARGTPAKASQPQGTPARSSKGVGAEPAVPGAAAASAEIAREAELVEPRALLLFDIDNTLYSAKLGIAQLMSVRIQAFFRDRLGLPADEAQELHHKYYKEYGLAVRGLVRHHKIDPLEYDRLCDQSLPLDTVLQPDERLKKLLAKIDRTKCRVIALTNAYKVHAHRVLNCLEIAHFFEEVIYCDYSKPNFACKPEKEYFDGALASLSGLDASEFEIPPPPHHHIGKTYFVDDSALNTRAARDVCKWHHVVHFKERMDDGTDVVAAGALALPAGKEDRAGEPSKADAVASTSNALTSELNTAEASAAAEETAKESDQNKQRAPSTSQARPDVGAPPKPTALDISLLQQAATSSALSLHSSDSSSSPGDAARAQLLKQLVRLSPSVRLELFRALLDSTPSTFTAHLGSQLALTNGSAEAESKSEDELDQFQAELDARRLADEEARARAERRRRLALYGGLWGAMDNVPRKVIVKVLGMLRIEDLITCRRVSKKWNALTYLPELWASHARELMQNDPGGPPVGDPMAMTLGLGLALPGLSKGLGLAMRAADGTAKTREANKAENDSAAPGQTVEQDEGGAKKEEGRAEDIKEGNVDPATLPRDKDGNLLPSEWELLVKKLVQRERNWAKGIAQKVQYMEGHTGFVTSMKLKGRKTLVTGSYDETIRVWDMHTGVCTKVLKAKAIACLDFLLPSADGSSGAILCAGLYDTGRVMVWDMKNWNLLQTLSGHNRGIRNVALSEDVLVSVGQDKAIVVWDWRTGTKLLKFGQQSNVSLGTSIVDKDKIVAVTVDGIIRTFCIRRKEMIGQFDLSKLGGVDKALSAQLAGIGGDGMLQWFAAHGNSMTLAAKNLVVHLEWTEHVVPIEENPVPLTRGTASTSKTGSGFSPSTSFRSSLGPSTPTVVRTRKDSSQTATSGSRPASRASLSPVQSTSGFRQRHDSTASSASTVVSSSASSSSTRTVAASTTGSVGRKSMPASAAAPTNGTPIRSGRTSVTSSHRPSLSSSTNGRGGFATPSAERRKSLQVNPNAMATSPGARPPLSPSSSFRFPSSSNGSTLTPLSPSGSQILELPSPAESKPVRTRIAPNLEVAPRIVSVLRTPDISTGCTDPAKRRVVCSTRFSSRSGADRRLYSSTYNVRESAKATTNQSMDSEGSAQGDDSGSSTPKLDNAPTDSDKTPSTAAGLADTSVGAGAVPLSPAPVSGSTVPADRDHSSSVVPIRGAWSAEREKLSQPTRNPMAMILDHESCVVGCQDGTVYKLSFVGDEYGDEPDEPEPEPEEIKPMLIDHSKEGEASAGHVTIEDLCELEQVWAELMLPDDAPEDHPGRWRPPAREEGNSAMEQLGFK